MKAWHIEDKLNVELVESQLINNSEDIKLKTSKVMLSISDLNFMLSNECEIKVPSHSVVAYISDEDNVLSLKLGSRVVVSPFKKRSGSHSSEVDVLGIDKDGFLQDFLSVPAELVYHLPDSVSDTDALFVESVAFGVNILESLNLNKGDYIVILGANTLGLVLAQLAVYYQLVPILVDQDNDKLQMAGNWGIYYTLNHVNQDIKNEVEQMTGGRMSDACVFVGNNVNLDSALVLLKHKGKAIIAGYSYLNKHHIDTKQVLKNQLTIEGIDNGFGEEATAINLLANKIVKTDGLVTDTIDFEKFDEFAYDAMKYPLKYNKIIVECD